MSLSFLSSNSIKVQYEVADAPQRAKDLQFAGHQAYFGCELCKAKAEPLTIDGRRVQSKRVWKPQTALGQRRKKEETLELAELAMRSEKISNLPNNNYGVKGRSHLFDLQDFDPMQQVLPEIMHMGFLGIVKLLAVLTFGIGKPRSSAKRNPRVKPEVLSPGLLNTKVPSEARLINIYTKVETSRLDMFTLAVQQCHQATGIRNEG